MRRTTSQAEKDCRSFLKFCPLYKVLSRANSQSEARAEAVGFGSSAMLGPAPSVTAGGGCCWERSLKFDHNRGAAGIVADGQYYRHWVHCPGEIRTPTLHLNQETSVI